jgi:hypothetical protein
VPKKPHLSVFSTVGITDAFVESGALALVEDCAVDAAGAPLQPKSIANACRALVELAGGQVRNARDQAGHLLRVCVVPKVTYLARTIEPRLFRAAARRADELLLGAFCAIYKIDAKVVAPHASPGDQWTAARIRAPGSHQGCGIRSAVATSEAAYLASWRTVAPLIRSASSSAASTCSSESSEVASLSSSGSARPRSRLVCAVPFAFVAAFSSARPGNLDCMSLKLMAEMPPG